MICIAVDDEPRALDIIENYAGKIDFLQLVNKFRNPLEAISFLSENDCDLVFLDINMPDITGTELLKVLKNSPMVIFTTAYSEYAVESYELDAIDYLLKPFEFDRFLKSVLKAKEKLNVSDRNQSSTMQRSNVPEDIIQIKSGKEIYQVKIREIEYIEGLGNYINVMVNNTKLIVYTSLKEFLAKLPEQEFIRIHKSYIVPVRKIKSFENHQVKLDNKTLPIGKNYRESFSRRMKKS
ncbi:LytR/AlgR family response regulator transcription factor [Saccharicrinis sp. FJH62]|uniref:LytR/AlgR family response regulator transcription factor n=1 Tax=Saccharicrinis sp. FJH62 TaxID=3344657 RepID=UPI0035D52A1D